MSRQDMLAVEVFEQSQHGWQTRHADIYQLCADRDALQGAALIFLPGLTCLPPHVTQSLHDAFGVPTSTWETQYQKATGYYCAAHTNAPNGDIGNHTTSFRFLIKTPRSKVTLSAGTIAQIPYGWTEIGLWTQYRGSHSSILICSLLDPCNTGLADDIRTALVQSGNDVSTSHPFGWHAWILPHISRVFHVAVWKWRDLIRDAETNRSSLWKHRTDYRALHELARHALHSTETLAMAVHVTEEIHDDLQSIATGHRQTSSQYGEVSRILKCQISLLRCEHGRSQALEGRLRNEIDLAFHISAQHDSHVAAQISDLARIDSASVRTISILGLLFLPGTFISGVFGMNFFSFTQDEQGRHVWMTSSNFWLYWVVTIPLTVGTVLVWRFSQRTGVSDH